jgi:hypothetical protein
MFYGKIVFVNVYIRTKLCVKRYENDFMV